MSTFIRPYRSTDFDVVYALWQSALATNWPLTPQFLARMVSGQPNDQEGDHFVAEHDGRVIGFIATQTDTSEKAGGIPLMLVAPGHQRQGIGTMLHTTAIERLRTQGVEKLSLGHGGGDYFWPGVPLNLPGAVDFFQSCGWRFPETAYDLTRDLGNYQTPPGLLERVTRQNIDLRPCSPDEAAAVVEFEQRVFPYWAKYYQMTADSGRPADILAAWDGTTVVGSLLMSKADLDGASSDAVWHSVLGDDMGTIAAVGVDDSRQGQGIGIALVARASEILQARGVRQCLIGWTGLLDFYDKLGYTPWRAYAMTED
jgi:beta-N-acetylhexosaminidase